MKVSVFMKFYSQSGVYVGVQLYVSVVDMNEHRPQFSRQQYVVSVPEDAAVGQSVATVECEDEDRGGEVMYDLHNARSPASLSLFNLHHETGVLSLTAPLDRSVPGSLSVTYRFVGKYVNSVKVQYSNSTEIPLGQYK